MPFIHGRCVVLVIHVVAASCLVGQDARPVRVVGNLKLHRVVKGTLPTGQTDEYTVHVKSRQFIHLVARQMGVDVAVTIVEPAGKTILEADRPNGAFGLEAASFIGQISGVYRVHVANGSEPAGPYQIELMDSRKPTKADRSRIEAETAEFQAARESQGRTRAARLHSIELYETANSIWRQLKDTYEEGVCLN